MPGLKIDYKNHQYIIQVHHGGGESEFVKIAEHSMIPDVKKTIFPEEEGIRSVQYNKETNSFTLAPANGTQAQAPAAQLSPPGPAAQPTPQPTSQPTGQ